MTCDPLAATASAVVHAGGQLLQRYSTETRQSGLTELLAAVDDYDAIVADPLQPARREILPNAGWLNDEHGSGQLDAGEWWLIDPVGGNINAVHGMTDWNIGVSLVREWRPVLAVLYFPLLDQMFTATEGGGAFLNGERLRVSDKTSLDGALVGTGQAKPGQDPDIADRMGSSFAAMMKAAIY